MLRALRIAAPVALLCCAACADAESAFTDGRNETACNQALPVCSSTAGCVLDGVTYARGTFQLGGSERVVVRTTSAADIAVSLFFRTEENAGTTTEIAWSEVNCRQRYSSQSGGRDVFVEAGANRVYTRTQRVTSAGDHLVEVFSDAQAEVLLKVSVTVAQ